MSCSDCGYCKYPTEIPKDMYKVKNGKIIVIENAWIPVSKSNLKGGFKLKKRRLNKFRKKIYPIRSGWYWYKHDYGYGIGWKEVHYCPKCKKDFSFFNGTH